MRSPWETKAQAKIVSLDNYLCNCNCNQSKNISLHNFYVCNVFVDNGKKSKISRF